MRAKTTYLTLAAVALAIAAGSITIFTRHNGATRRSAAVKAQTISDDDLKSALRSAGVPVRNLVIRTVGDITVLRGDTDDTETIAKAGQIVKQLGAQRVANLIRVPTAPDDDAIRREAERQLARSRALDGCTFAVSCSRGVLKVNGRVQSDLQADAARTLLNTVRGVQRIEAEFAR
jgi:osmotically-inducible protein OsmY